MAAAKCRNRRRELTDTLQAVSTDTIHNIRVSFRNLQFIQNIQSLSLFSLLLKKVIHTMLFCAIVQGFRSHVRTDSNVKGEDIPESENRNSNNDGFKHSP